jgi:DNA-binding NtrC family response regulator
MPAITLDEGAREALEGYYWPGNVRQLKNVAEQISAIEQTRLVTAPIVLRYLPPEHITPAMMHTGDGTTPFGDEREILYRILFDLRSDVMDIKRTLNELRAGSEDFEPHREIAGLLPSKGGTLHYDTFDASEEVDDDYRTMTKDDATREAIVKALQKAGGKRKEAARQLFISERTLYRKMKELGVD